MQAAHESLAKALATFSDDVRAKARIATVAEELGLSND
jgi:predicted dinucleotide-binding enzyme